MSDYLPNRLRQPGGLLKRCTPSDPSQPSNTCDCYICDNTGRPDSIRVLFGGFFDGATTSYHNCASLNNTTQSHSRYGSPLSGWLANYAATTQGDPFNLGTAGVSCLYDCDPVGLLGSQDCMLSANSGDLSGGSKCEVAFGWSETRGVFVTVSIDGTGSSTLGSVYYWGVTGLEQYLVGGAGIGDIVCWGDRATANTLAWLIDQAVKAANGGDGNDESWHWTREFSDLLSDGTTCYVCQAKEGEGGGVGTQPDAVVSLIFDPHATKTAPPCCCGDKTPPQPCFFVCFTRSASTDGDCGDGLKNCQPYDGQAFYLCYNSKTKAYEGRGNALTNPLQASLTESDGNWTLQYGCGGLNATADLTVDSTSPFEASADAQANGGCGDGCLDISVTRDPKYCPPSLACVPGPICDCDAAEKMPPEIKVTLPGLLNRYYDVEFGTPPCIRCPAYGGEYFLAYSGPQNIGLASFDATWSAWIPGHCGYPDDQASAGYTYAQPCKFYNVNYFAPNGDWLCPSCVPQLHATGPDMGVYDCPYLHVNENGPTDSFLIYGRSCGGARLVLFIYLANCSGGQGAWQGSQLWQSDLETIDPTKACCPQLGAALNWISADSGLVEQGLVPTGGLATNWCHGLGTTAAAEPICLPSN